jgi:O-antigen ligase
MKESVYSVFIFSASIKLLLDRYGYSAPADITMISGAILFILIVINTRSVNKDFIPGIVILLLFYSVIFFSLLYTSSQKYAFEKCLYFGTNIIAFLFPILNYKTFDLNNFFKSTIFLSLTIAILYFFGTNVSGEILLDYLIVAQLFQIALVMSILLKANIFKYAVILIFTASILLLGARAIMLTSILIPIMLISKQFKIKLRNIAIISGFAVLMIISLQNVLNPLFWYSMDRLFLLADFTSDVSAMERVSQYSFVISNYLNEPSKYLFGYGIGSFGQEYLNQDIRSHPHNILLETIFETGLVGFLLLVAFIIVALHKFSKANWLNHKEYRIVCIILLLLLLNAMKSSSLDGQRDLFCFIAILHVLTQKYDIERKTKLTYVT